jgi:glycosyltransferase involved in cell wall biosynthesis
MKNLKKIIPWPIKRLIIFFYILLRLIMRGRGSRGIILNLSGVLPPLKSREIVHGGKVKLLHLRETFGDSWKNFNIAYFVSSGLPFAPEIWLKLYKLFGIPVVWNQNGVAYPAVYSRGTIDKVNNLLKPIHKSDYVFYQSEFVKRCADKYLGKFQGPSSVLINPVDTTHFFPLTPELPQDPFTILMLGNHLESKERMQVSLRAVKKLQEKGIKLKLIILGNLSKSGSRVDERDFDVEIKHLGLEGQVVKHGPYLQTEAPKIFQSAHIFLHLKYLDPCPPTVIEALSCGLPVVAMASGGLPELVDESSGVLIPVSEDFEELHYPTPDQVAEAVVTVKNNLSTYSKGARVKALQFDKEAWVNKHKEVFEKLCPTSL